MVSPLIYHLSILHYDFEIIRRVENVAALEVCKDTTVVLP